MYYIITINLIICLKNSITVVIAYSVTRLYNGLEWESKIVIEIVRIRYNKVARVNQSCR